MESNLNIFGLLKIKHWKYFIFFEKNGCSHKNRSSTNDSFYSLFMLILTHIIITHSVLTVGQIKWASQKTVLAQTTGRWPVCVLQHVGGCFFCCCVLIRGHMGGFGLVTKEERLLQIFVFHFQWNKKKREKKTYNHWKTEELWTWKLQSQRCCCWWSHNVKHLSKKPNMSDMFCFVLIT